MKRKPSARIVLDTFFSTAYFHLKSYPFIKLLPKSSFLLLKLCFVFAFCLSPALTEGRTINFEGRQWIVKSGYVGPGPNYFSDSEQSVWVDADGLHLKIRKIGSTWYCAEIYSEEVTQHGMHRFYVDGRVDLLDKNVVLGLFIYANDNEEIDIEFARWGISGGTNAQFVVQPYSVPGNKHTFDISLNGDYSTHYIDWQTSFINFKSFHGHYEEPPSSGYIIDEWTYTGGDNPPESSNLRIHMNLWLYQGNAPSDGQEVEVIIKRADFPAPPPDTTPPTPNPMTWATQPYETSTSSISMVATTATDPTTPISYYFQFYSSPTGGAGGTSSGWQSSTTYTDSGLSANHQYGYRVKARDGNNNQTSYSSPVSYDYTDIEAPSGITFCTITTTSIQAKSSNTPSGLTRGSSGLKIYNTTKGTDSGWKQNNDYWISGGLSVNTQYGFRAKARNGDGDLTGYCSTAYKYTRANPPGSGSFSDISETCIRANWTTNGNPPGTQYYCEDTTRGTSSGWITSTSWLECGLNCGTTYCYRVKARNGDGLETGWMNLGCASTLSCTPEINLKQGPTNIPDGTGSYDFGGVDSGNNKSVIFTVENLGDAALELTGSPIVNITGSHASDFVVTQQPLSSIQPSASSAFEITFSPNAEGMRSATVMIANNDSDEDPYNFSITGTGNCLISGYVMTSGGSALPDVNVSADNNGSSDITDGLGYYSLNVPYSWSGRVILSRMAYDISPAYRDYINVTSSQSNQDYTGFAVDGDKTYDVNNWLVVDYYNPSAPIVDANITVQYGYPDGTIIHTTSMEIDLDEAYNSFLFLWTPADYLSEDVIGDIVKADVSILDSNYVEIFDDIQTFTIVSYPVLRLVDKFSDGLTEKELIFADANSQSCYLEVPKDANVTSAYLNLSGYTEAWNIQYASYNNINISTQDVGSSGLFFKSDGTKLYEIGRVGDKIYQYTCSDAWNLSSCSYDNINISTQSSTPRSFFFKSDGTKLYELDSYEDKIYQYTCSDAWNLSSCSYDTVLISTQDSTPTGFFFKSDGTKLYEVGMSEDKIYQYTCSDAWSLGSCSYDAVLISTQGSAPEGLFFKSDGTKLYEITAGEDKIYQYTCSDAWNLSSCSYDDIYISTQDNDPEGFFFKPDGTKLYEIGRGGAKIYQYSLDSFFINNPYLEIGTPDGTYEWSYSGEFNETNEKTNNLAPAINAALNNGACDCNGCIVDGDCCHIPLLFHSDSAGIINVSNVRVFYEPTGHDKADLDGIDPVDYEDLSILVDDYLQNGPYLFGDINRDTVVDLKDFALLAEYWLTTCDCN